MGTAEKLIIKAKNSPQNLRFEEFCKLCEILGMKPRKVSSGHFIYKYKGSPSYTQSIQNVKGKAKPYQVKQLLTWAERIGFLEDFLKKKGENNV